MEIEIMDKQKLNERNIRETQNLVAQLVGHLNNCGLTIEQIAKLSHIPLERIENIMYGNEWDLTFEDMVVLLHVAGYKMIVVDNGYPVIIH